MKKKYTIFTAVLISMVLSGCSASIEKPGTTDATENSNIEMQTETEKSAEEEITEVNEEATKAETEKSTEAEAETEKPTEAETEESTEAETEKPTEAETEEPAKAETKESNKAEADEPANTETEESTKAETVEPTKAEAEKSTEAETDEPTKAETEESTKAEKIEVFALNGPLGRYQSPAEFGDAKFAASFTKDDLVKMDDGTLALNVMIYRYELFSGDDINALKEGDVIWCLGREVVIDTIKTTDYGAVVINGGIEYGGRVLKTNDGSVYFESGMNDVKSYYEIGENQYVLSDNFVFTDNSVFGESVTYTAEEFFAMDYGPAGFINSNTIVKTDNNVITSIERNYIP